MKAGPEKKEKSGTFRWRYLVHDIVKWLWYPSAWVYFRPKRYFVSREARKKLKHGSALLAANHTGRIDPLRIFMGVWFRRVHCVATDVLFKRSAFHHWFYSTVANCIPVDTERPGLGFFNDACDRLKEGRVVAIFPEGHINRGETLVQDFKSGSLLLAMRSGAPVVPVYIRPVKHWYQRLRIAVGEPIVLRELYGGSWLTLEQLDDAAAYLQEKVEELEQLVHQ